MSREKKAAPPGEEGADRFQLILQNVRDFAIFSADLNG